MGPSPARQQGRDWRLGGGPGIVMHCCICNEPLGWCLAGARQHQVLKVNNSEQIAASQFPQNAVLAAGQGQGS